GLEVGAQLLIVDLQDARLGVADPVEAGLVIGRDLSVIGFDNEAYTADMLPPLTTMELPHVDMARHAVEELVAMINHQKTPSRPARLKFDCQMIQRQSVSPLPVPGQRRETV
ncbi:MAG: substrate-binding domain-containing protein, partial [Pseudomonadota bacterium]